MYVPGSLNRACTTHLPIGGASGVSHPGREGRVRVVPRVLPRLELRWIEAHLTGTAAVDEPRQAEPGGRVRRHVDRRLRRVEAPHRARPRQLVVAGVGGESHPLPGLDLALGLADEQEVRRLVLVDVAGCAPSVVRHEHAVVDEVVGMQRRVGPLRLAIGTRQRPDHLVVAEVGGHVHLEQEPVAARQETRRLAQVRAAGVEPVVRTGRDVDFLFPVPIEVAEDQVEGPVGVGLPSFVGGHHLLARRERLPHLAGFLGAALLHGPDDDRRRDEQRAAQPRRQPASARFVHGRPSMVDDNVRRSRQPGPRPRRDRDSRNAGTPGR